MPSDATVFLKRWRAALGLRGLAGSIMAVVAGVVLVMAWRLHLEQLRIERRADQLARSAATTPAKQPARKGLDIVSLPYAS